MLKNHECETILQHNISRLSKMFSRIFFTHVEMISVQNELCTAPSGFTTKLLLSLKVSKDAFPPSTVRDVHFTAADLAGHFVDEYESTCACK
jgi:hypothetical protein